jgi:nitrogen regulatory protein P-II 1
VADDKKGRAIRVKKIEAIIKPFRLEEVRCALAQLGHEGLTVVEVKGRGRQKGHTEFYKTTEYTNGFLSKLVIVVVLADSEVEAAVNAIASAARTGKSGDGTIFISTIDEVVRIRTGKMS